MPSRPDVRPSAAPSRSSRESATRWLLLVHQLPASPSNLRVRTWRRLQQLGAIAVKQAVYVLPDSPGAREDFEWLKTEIDAAGGEAAVFAAASVDAWSDDALVEEFRRSRQDAYAALAEEIEAVLGKIDAPRRRQGRAPAIERLLEGFRERAAAIDRIDFFGSAGRDRVRTLLGALDERVAKRAGRGRQAVPGTPTDLTSYHGRLWVTRPRPGVDRMSSAWLIRRFIDPDARFGFAADRGAVPPDAIPFDMFGVEFTHQGDRCTFETLCAAFDIRDPAVHRLGAIVHDLDLKDERFQPAEAPAVGMIIDGLRLAFQDDDALLAQGVVLFDALYRAAERSARPAGPRAVARKPRASSRPGKRPRASRA